MNLLKTIKNKYLPFVRGFYRCSWNQHDILIDSQSSYKLENFVQYGSLPYVGTGWYMLEVSVASSTIRTKIGLVKSSASGNPELFPLLVSRDRLAKRLIFLDLGSQVSLVYDVSAQKVCISSFRLVRVSSKFAFNRIIKKLTELHPLYKSGGVSRQKNNLANRTQLVRALLWEDYKAIFSGGENLFPYASWIEAFPSPLPTPSVVTQVRPDSTPLFTIILPTFKPSQVWLSEAIESVFAQQFSDWELIIVDDGSGDPDLNRFFESLVRSDSRVIFRANLENEHISAASNLGLQSALGKWVIFLDHDDLLNRDALHHVNDAISLNQDCALIYSDVDKIDEFGTRSEPYFKPNWNPDLFLSQNLFSHLGAYRVDLVRAVGGFRVGLEGSQDYDLALRCSERVRYDQIVHIPRVLYHWRIHAGSTAHAMEAKPYAIAAGERALNEHLQRMGALATAETVGYGYRVRYALPVKPPLVSLIIPTRNGLKLIKQCIDSIFAKTDYPHYELIVVDNGSDDKATLRYLASLSNRGHVNAVERVDVRVMHDDRPFNYSALNNAAVKLARGEVLGLLNNDLEVINDGWLTEMVSHALRPEVGAVGARLWYSDDTLQHAGVVLGIHGVAGHVHRFLPRGNVGYCGRAALIQSFSAVTGACLVVRKALYEEVGGLNEVELQVAANDIDFCLRLREAGYRNIWTPYAELYHHESASRGFDDTPDKQARSAKEVAYMHQRWGDALRNDPAYSPNLTLDAEDFGLAWPPRVVPIAQSSTASTP